MQTTVVGVAAPKGNSSINLSQNPPSSLEYPADDEMQDVICEEGGF